MRHIFAVSKRDTHMQLAKSMQKNNESVLFRRYAAALVAEIHAVTTGFYPPGKT